MQVFENLEVVETVSFDGGWLQPCPYTFSHTVNGDCAVVVYTSGAAYKDYITHTVYRNDEIIVQQADQGGSTTFMATKGDVIKWVISGGHNGYAASAYSKVLITEMNKS